MGPNSGPLVDHQSTLSATEGGPLVGQWKSLSLAADSGPLKVHQKTVLSATNSGPLPISRSRQRLATACSQRRTDSYAASGPAVALQSLAIWVAVGFSIQFHMVSYCSAIKLKILITLPPRCITADGVQAKCTTWRVSRYFTTGFTFLLRHPPVLNVYFSWTLAHACGLPR